MRVLAAVVAAALAAEEGWELPPELPPPEAVAPLSRAPVTRRPPRALSDAELEAAARAQAKRDANAEEWFLAGLGSTCLLSAFGCGAVACYAHEGPVDDPESAVEPEQLEAFTDAYEREVHSIRTEHAIYGGLTAAALVIGGAIAVAVAAGAADR